MRLHFSLPDGSLACPASSLPPGDEATPDATRILRAASPCAACRDAVVAREPPSAEVPQTREESGEGWTRPEIAAERAMSRTILIGIRRVTDTIRARDTQTAARLSAALESADPFPRLRALLADLTKG